jgi:hypothetical protein
MQIEAKVDLRDAEARRNAVQGLQGFVTRCIQLHSSLLSGCGFNIFSRLPNMLSCTLDHAACDYSTDNRGDVGSWVRSAALTAIQQILLAVYGIRYLKAGASVSSEEKQLVADGINSVITMEMTINIVGHLLRQMGERMDSVRFVAGTVLESLVLSNPANDTSADGSATVSLPVVLHLAPHHQLMRGWFEEGAKLNDEKLQGELDRAFAAANLKPESGQASGSATEETTQNDSLLGMGWKEAPDTFPSLFRCLQLPEYRYRVMEGLAGCIGGMTESLMRCGVEGIVQFFNKDEATTNEMREAVVADMCSLCTAHKGDNRFIVQLLKTFTTTATNGCLKKLAKDKQGKASRFLDVFVTHFDVF